VNQAAEELALAPVEKAPATIRDNRRQLWLTTPWPLLLTLCGLSALWTALFGNPLESIEMRWLGSVLRWRYERGWAPPADPHIVHVDIDRHDLEALPTLDLEYQNAATIIRQTTALGARVIAFDAILTRGTPALAQPILDEIARVREQSRSVVMAEALMPLPEQAELQRIRSFPRQPRHEPSGLINVQADADGVFRHYRLAQRGAGGGYEPSLALACYLAWREVSWSAGVSFPKPATVRWEEISADFTSTEPHELNVEPAALLNFRSPWSGTGPSTFRHFTVAQLGALHGQSQANTGAKPLENAIVLVGYVGAGLGDVGVTPLAPNQPRVLLHSTALNDLIQRNWLRRSPHWIDALAFAAVALLGAAAFFCRRMLPLLLLWLAVLAAMAATSVALILNTGWVPGLVAAGMVWTAATGLELARRYSFELIERLKLRATMGLYFSPRVMERVLRNPGSMEPQEAELTVLLTDLRNSTPITECLGPHGTFGLLNQVFEAQTQAIMAEDGSLEHFLGDQFLSYWGAPDPQPDAADRAMRAALALIIAMENLRPTFVPRVQEVFGYGVALHSGTALFGNKGSAQRLDFGLVGDLINSAARVESLTKYYGVLFLITREACDKLTAPPQTRVIDEVIVKGKSVPLQLREVRHAFSPARFDQIAAGYEAAFASYQSGDFLAAEKLFIALIEQEQDRPSALMAERCRELANTPPRGWCGVYELKTK
jgi:class 3 adenylate cyclase/CHASE2 domain-containing sensor protein